jgi:hypothetical protein
VDGDSAPRPVELRDSTLGGVWIADLDTAALPAGTVVHVAVGGTTATVAVERSSA